MGWDWGWDGGTRRKAFVGRNPSFLFIHSFISFFRIHGTKMKSSIPSDLKWKKIITKHKRNIKLKHSKHLRRLSSPLGDPTWDLNIPHPDPPTFNHPSSSLQDCLASIPEPLEHHRKVIRSRERGGGRGRSRWCGELACPWAHLSSSADISGQSSRRTTIQDITINQDVMK